MGIDALAGFSDARSRSVKRDITKAIPWEAHHVSLQNMKAIRVTLDEVLLARLDADEEVRRDGRSAVIRRATDEYLKRRRERAVAEQYAQAYGANSNLGTEFRGWEDERVWPEQ
jgi:hypothetical protein